MRSASRRPNSTTLSISLTPALAEAVRRRVDSGLYTSASELIREALRLLLLPSHSSREDRSERGDMKTLESKRLATAIELMDFGFEMRSRRKRAPRDDDVDAPGAGLVESPERLDQLRREA